MNMTEHRANTDVSNFQSDEGQPSENVIKHEDWRDEDETDWEFIFEDSSVGLIPLIMIADTSVSLRSLALLIIRKVYNRRSDAQEITRLNERLTKIVRDDLTPEEFENARHAVIRNLRQIKNFRLQNRFHPFRLDN
jgi:hypothetical protein